MIRLSSIAESLVEDRLPLHPGSRFKRLLVSYLEDEKQNAHTPERSPGMHISGLAYVCARQVAIIHYLNREAEKHLEATFEDYNELVASFLLEEEEEPVTDAAGSVLTSDYGTALHDWYQNRYLGPARLLWGLWRCVCGSRTEGLMPLKCEACGKHWYEGIRYQEYGIKTTIGGVPFEGHCDGVFQDPEWGPNRRFVFELKTLSSYKYNETKKPRFIHVVQTHGYMHGLGLKESLIVYIDRGKQCEWDFRTGNPVAGDVHIKAFHVPFNEDLWSALEAGLSDFKTTIDAINKDPTIYDGKTLEEIARPIVPVCDIKSCDTAKRCPVREECFALDV